MKHLCPKCGKVQDAKPDDLMGRYWFCCNCRHIFLWEKAAASRIFKKMKKRQMKIKIIIVDDHQVLRYGLRYLVEKQPDMEVVAEAENGITALSLARKFKPEVVLMDISMPVLNGLKATRLITRDMADVKIIALSNHSDKQHVAAMFKAGAAGYLMKDGASRHLVCAIRKVISNQLYLCPNIVARACKC